MRITKRVARKEAYANGYRSKFELDIAKYLENKGINFLYEKCVLNYVVPETKKRYTPDWQIGEGQNIFYESKGRFTAVDRMKILLVRKANPTVLIRMIFQNSAVRISKSSKTTYADWCDKNKIEWCDFKKGIPKEWLKANCT